jgi:hypothetical protein
MLLSMPVFLRRLIWYRDVMWSVQNGRQPDVKAFLSRTLISGGAKRFGKVGSGKDARDSQAASTSSRTK